MAALALVFCLQSTPGTCTEHRPAEQLSLQVSLVRAQQYAAEWLAEHPKWLLSRWRCEPDGSRQQPV